MQAQAQPVVVHALPGQTTTTQVRPDLELSTLHLINSERRAAGLAPLMPHATIREVARRHAQEMFASGYLSHQSLDGRTPEERVRRTGVRVRTVRENLVHASDIRAAHAALMSSFEHRQKIVWPGFRLVGVGVVAGGAFGIIVVEDFAH